MSDENAEVVEAIDDEDTTNIDEGEAEADAEPDTNEEEGEDREPEIDDTLELARVADELSAEPDDQGTLGDLTDDDTAGMATDPGE